MLLMLYLMTATKAHGSAAPASAPDDALRTDNIDFSQPALSNPTHFGVTMQAAATGAYMLLLLKPSLLLLLVVEVVLPKDTGCVPRLASLMVNKLRL